MRTKVGLGRMRLPTAEVDEAEKRRWRKEEQRRRREARKQLQQEVVGGNVRKTKVGKDLLLRFSMKDGPFQLRAVLPYIASIVFASGGRLLSGAAPSGPLVRSL